MIWRGAAEPAAAPDDTDSAGLAPTFAIRAAGERPFVSPLPHAETALPLPGILGTKLCGLAAALALGSLTSCGTYRGCEPVAGQILRCTTTGENGRVDFVWVAAPVDRTPQINRVLSLERGVTGGPSLVAVDTCGARNRVYLLGGLFAVDTTSAPFDVEDLTGNYAPTREAALTKRDSLFAARPTCLVRDEM